MLSKKIKERNLVYKYKTFLIVVVTVVMLVMLIIILLNQKNHRLKNALMNNVRIFVNF